MMSQPFRMRQKIGECAFANERLCCHFPNDLASHSAILSSLARSCFQLEGRLHHLLLGTNSCRLSLQGEGVLRLTQV